MKTLSRNLVTILAFTAMLLSSCGGSSTTALSDSTGLGKAQFMPVQFTGPIEAVNGNQWVVNGQTITVDPAVVRDGPFKVGDVVKVEVNVQPDGSVVVTRVELPNSLSEAVESEIHSAEEQISAGLDPISTQDPVSNLPIGGGMGLDDNNPDEVVGAVQAIDGNSVTIDGQMFQFASNAEIKDQVAVGDMVKLHLVINSDGTTSITEMEILDQVNEDDSTSGSDNGAGGISGGNHDKNDDKSGSHNDDQQDDHSGSGNDDSHDD